MGAEHNSNFKDNSVVAHVGGNQSRGIHDPTVEGDMESRSPSLGRADVTGGHASPPRGDARPEVALPLESGGRSYSVRVAESKEPRGARGTPEEQ